MENWRARIGMIYPASGLSESEFLKLAPPGVTVHTTRIWFGRESAEENIRMTEFLESAAQLLAMARVDLILLNSTTGSVIKGAGYDRQLIERIELATRIPAITTATCALQALRALGIKRLSLVTPYPKETTDLEVKFLTQNGIQVISSYGDGISDPFVQATTDPEYWVKVTASQCDEDADGVFLSCAGIRIVDRIAELENKIGHPLITSNQAAMWGCLRKLGLSDNPGNYGKLFEIS